MNAVKFMMTIATITMLATPAMAQTVATQRDVNQQDRIEQGLQSGQLNNQEASQLENGEARIDRTEAHDMSNGSLSPAEKAQIQHMQNAESNKISADNHDTITGNPNSASTKRMEADVKRDANQETRINQGVRSGALTDKETASLERGQSRDDHAEAHADATRGVSAREQAHLQNRLNQNSKRIYNKKHN
jgi:hypothetical protein